MSPSSDDRPTRRALLIVNPGARKAVRAQYHATRAFAHQKVHCDVLTTDSPGHATALAREHASRYDVVFTLGGDGTAMEVITALADVGPPIGILPAGTANVLVRALGIPLHVAPAVHALLNGREAHIDLGRLQSGRHFAIGLGVGIDATMIAGASPLMKKRVGAVAYVWSAAKAALRLEHFQVRLTVDGKVYERRAAFVLIANLGSVPLFGRLIRFGDGILHDDGVLHACVFSPANFLGAVRIFVRLLLGNLKADPATLYVSGREFRLETVPPRQAQADGELLEMTPVDVTVRPQAARVLVPRD
ncbi:MAG TPA: diacylglycerol kinase family protein [Gemmatimonadaceae bacterium]